MITKKLIPLLLWAIGMLAKRSDRNLGRHKATVAFHIYDGPNGATSYRVNWVNKAVKIGEIMNGFRLSEESVMMKLCPDIIYTADSQARFTSPQK